MQIPNLALACLIAELQPLVAGSIARKIQELENGWLKIRLQTKLGSKDLILAPNAFFITEYSFPAKQETSGFGAFLRKRLQNRKIVSLAQHGLDRIALVEFPEHFLILELFAKGNIILADKQMQILSPLRKEQWKGRELKKGAKYSFPPTKGANPAAITAPELKKIFSQSNVDAARALISGLNIAPFFAEHACALAGVEKSGKAAALGEKEIEKISAALREIHSPDLKSLRPAIAEKDNEQFLTPFETSAPNVRILQRFGTLNEAVDSVYSKKTALPEAKKSSGSFERKKSGLDATRLLRQQAAIAEFQADAEENRKKGEMVYAHYRELSELLLAYKPLKAEKKEEKAIMYTLQNRFPFLKKIDLKNKKAVLQLNETN